MVSSKIKTFICHMHPRHQQVAFYPNLIQTSFLPQRQLDYSPVIERGRLGNPLHDNCSRMRSKGSRFTLGVWGLRVCSLDVAEPSATVRNRSQPSAVGPYGRAYGKFCRGGHFWSFQTCRCFVSRGRRGTSWTFRRVLQRVESRFAWQAQYFCDVFRRYVAVFVAGAALWTRPSSFFVAGAAL